MGVAHALNNIAQQIITPDAIAQQTITPAIDRPSNHRPRGGLLQHKKLEVLSNRHGLDFL